MIAMRRNLKAAELSLTQMTRTVGSEKHIVKAEFLWRVYCLVALPCLVRSAECGEDIYCLSQDKGTQT